MLATSTLTRLGSLAVLLALSLSLTGCSLENKKITKANFDKIKNDMTIKQVQEILGDETSGGGDGSNVAAQVGVDVTMGGGSPTTVDYVWENGKKTITVTFKHGKVMGKRSTGL